MTSLFGLFIRSQEQPLVFLSLFLLFSAPHSISALTHQQYPPSSSESATTKNGVIRIGSRPSPLATIQAKAVESHLKQNHRNLETVWVPIDASGDIITSSLSNPSSPSSVIQNEPLAFSNVDFTTSLDQALLDGRIDIAVHSLKDIPPDHRWNGGSGKLQIHCPLPREDSHDVLITCKGYNSIAKLPMGAKVGTSSIRRQSQVLYKNPNVQVVNLRGNVETRLQALQQNDVDALILAESGLNRLHIWDDNDSSDANEIQYHEVPYQDILPGTCQGIVAAVVCADGSFDTGETFWKCDDTDSTIMACAERQFLNVLDEATPWKGRPPLGGIMEKYGLPHVNQWQFQGILASTDGKQIFFSKKECELPIVDLKAAKKMAAKLGKQVAQALLEQTGPTFFDGQGPKTTGLSKT